MEGEISVPDQGVTRRCWPSLSGLQMRTAQAPDCLNDLLAARRLADDGDVSPAVRRDRVTAVEEKRYATLRQVAAQRRDIFSVGKFDVEHGYVRAVGLCYRRDAVSDRAHDADVRARPVERLSEIESDERLILDDEHVTASQVLHTPAPANSLLRSNFPRRIIGLSTAKSVLKCTDC